MKFSIRQAKLTDAETVFTMIDDLEHNTLQKKIFLRAYGFNLEEPSVHYLVAIFNKQIVGFVSLHIQNLIHHIGKVAEIQELYVREDARGLGIGKALVDRVKQIAKSKKCSSFEVATNMKRTRTQHFYATKIGMQQTHYKFTEKL